MSLESNLNYQQPPANISMKPENDLFVDEDDGSVSDTASTSEFQEALEEEEDPIIDSIPLVMNQVPAANQSIHLLQYPGKPKSHHSEVSKVSVKPGSNYVEVRVPLETKKFYDESKAEEWGTRVADHGLQGVFNKSEGGLYVAKIITDSDNTRKILLVPVDSTAQLRPSFKYLDDVDNARLGNSRKQEVADTKPSSVHILQSSAKSTGVVNSDGVPNNALGEALKHIKKFEDEDWQQLNWRDIEDSKSKELRQHLSAVDGVKLSTTTTMDEYIHDLTQ